MARHSSTLAWKIPWMEEPCGLQSMRSHRVGHDWDFTFTFHFQALEKEMATHSSALAWRIPGTGEPGGLLSMGSHRVGHDWSDLAAAFIRLQPPQRGSLSKLRMGKHRILAPDSWGAYQRNDFSEPRLLHLPMHRKALNSLRHLVFFYWQ